MLGTILGESVCVVLFPVFGALADRVGAYRMFLPTALLWVLCTYPMFMFLVSEPSIHRLIAMQLVAAIFQSALAGPHPGMLAMIFPARVRTLGVSLSYNLAVTLFGGMAPLTVTTLIAWTGDKLIPAAYIVTSSAISIILVIGTRTWRAAHDAPERFPVSDTFYERKPNFEALLADAQQLNHMGSFNWQVASAEIMWSDESFRILGYDLCTKPTVDLLLARTHPEDAALVRQVITEAANDRRGFDIEYRLLMPDATVKYVHAVAHVVADKSDNLRVAGMLMDVTVRQKAHAALERSEQRFRSLFHDMPVGLWQIDALPLMAMMSKLRAQGVKNLSNYIDAHPGWLERAQERLVIEEVNNYAVKMFGARERSELLGPVSWVWRESPGTFRRVLESRYRGEEHFEETTRLPTLDGRIIDVQFTVARPRAISDLGIGLISLVDLTERIRAHVALERLQTDFAHAARISMLGELTASIAHELKQPLAAIVTNGEAVQRWLGRPDPDIAEIRAANTRMVNDTRRAVDIVSRIHGMATRQTPEHRLISLDELIEGVLMFLRHEVQARGVTVLHRPALGAPRVLADRVQLQQVIVNLAVNAMQAMEQANSETHRITIRTSVPDVTTLRCSVEDSGPGISSDHIRLLFESFFTTKPDGMGLGLPICRSIIESHGGHITADNESIHGGARLYFELPAARSMRQIRLATCEQQAVGEPLQ